MGAVMRRLLALGLVAGMVACHKTPQVQPRVEREIGDYSYRTMIGPTLVTGEFSIEPDTVTVDAHLHSCRRVDTGLIGPTVHPFTCRGGPTAFSVVIDSRRPTFSTWSSTERSSASGVSPLQKLSVRSHGSITPSGASAAVESFAAEL